MLPQTRLLKTARPKAVRSALPLPMNTSALFSCTAQYIFLLRTYLRLYAEQLKTGEVVFRNIDISESENEEIANKYQVTWSSLYIVKHKDGKETTKNLTRFAFANARNAPDKFKSEVIKEVNKMLEE